MNIFLDYKNVNFIKLSLLFFLFIFFSEAVLTQNSSSEIRNGKNVYEISCSVCHQAGLAGAPIFGNPSSWGDRKNKTLEELTNKLFETTVLAALTGLLNSTFAAETVPGS